jgi:hypothetical protein
MRVFLTGALHLVALSSLCVSALAQGPCVAPPAGLSHWFRGQSSAANQVGGPAAVLQGSVGYAQGRVGSAFDFSNGVARVSSAPELEGQQFTIEAWVFPRSSGGFADTVGPVIVAKDRCDCSPSISYTLAGPSVDGRYSAFLGFTDGSTVSVFSGTTFGYGGFRHVAAVWNGSALKLYVDGNLEASADYGPKTIIYGGHDVGVGRHPLFGTRNFDGLIDEASFYSVPLSAAEVFALFQAGSAGKCLPSPEGPLPCSPEPPTCVRGDGGPCLPKPAGLLAWWPGDNSPLDIEATHHGANYGSGYAAGLVGPAFNFTGDGRRVLVPAADLEPQQFTLQAWVYPTAPGVDSVGSTIAVRWYDQFSAHPAAMWLHGPRADGSFASSIGFAAGSPGQSTTPEGVIELVSPPGSATLFEWRHLALTWNGVEARFYVDGVDANLDVDGPPTSRTMPPGTTHVLYNPAGRFVIGDYETGGRSFVGLVDEVQLYDRALTCGEICAAVAAGSSGYCKPANACLTRPPGMIGYWPGTLVADPSNGQGIVKDVVAGNDLRYFQGIGSQAPYAGGNVTAFNGPGLVFNVGTTSTGYVAKIPHVPDLAPSSMTVAAWANAFDQAAGPGDLVGPTVVVKWHDPPSGTVLGSTYWIHGPGYDGKYRANINFAVGRSLIMEGLPANFPWTLFHHLALSYDEASRTAVFYIDGAAVDSKSLPNDGGISSLQYDLTGPFTVGGYADGGRGFPGIIDEVMLFNRALGGAEVAAIHASGFSALCQSPPDVSPPCVRIDSPADDAIIGATSVVVGGYVFDESGTIVTSTPAGIFVVVPPGGGPFSGVVPLPVEGLNSISVHAVDDPQNPPGGASVDVIRDTTNPDLKILSPEFGAVVSSVVVPVVVSVVDASAVTLAYGGETRTVPSGGPVAIFDVALVPGPNVVVITGVDAAGKTACVERVVTLDVDLPSVEITSPANGAVFGAGSSNVVVSATVEDASATNVDSAPSGVAGSLPPGGGSVIGSVSLVEGFNLIKVVATDAASLQGSDEKLVILDTTPPLVALTSPPTGAPIRGLVEFDASVVDVAPGSGVASVEFVVDGVVAGVSAAPPYAIALDTRLLGDGAHELAVRAVDGAGNASPPATRSIVVDNLKPTAVFAGVAEGSVVSGDLAFSISLADATSGVVSCVVTANGVAPTTDPSAVFEVPASAVVVVGSENTTLRPDGPLALSCTVIDAAGNCRTTEVRVVVQNTISEYVLVRPAPGARVQGSLTIEATSNDPYLSNVAVSVDGVVVGSGTASPLAVLYDTTTRLDGTATVVATFTKIGGETIVRAATVFVDNLQASISPETLHIGRKDPPAQTRVVATIEGPNAALLLPTTGVEIELRVPGASAVPAAQEWPGDDTLKDRDGDGVPELRVRFERRLVVGAIRAGVAAGRIDPNAPVECAIYARPTGGAAVLIGFDLIRIVGAD